MPPAPRKPTHEMKAFSRDEKRNGARHANTAAGRATNISVEATATAGKMLSPRRARQAPPPGRRRPAPRGGQPERRDLGQPGHRIEKNHHRIVGARRAIADPETGKID